MGVTARARPPGGQPPRSPRTPLAAFDRGAGDRAPTAWSSTSTARADGALVVRHDAATPAGLLAEHDLGRRPGGPARGPDARRGRSTPVRGRLVNVEIKNSPGDARPRSRTERRRGSSSSCVQARGRPRPRLVSSFNLPTVDRVHDPRSRRSRPRCSRARSRPARSRSSSRPRARARRAQPRRGRRPGRPAGRAAVERARELGLELNVWTVNDRAPDAPSRRRRRRRGITDVPDVARAGPRPDV